MSFVDFVETTQVQPTESWLAEVGEIRLYLARIIAVCYEFYSKNDESAHSCWLAESSVLYLVSLRDAFTDSEW